MANPDISLMGATYSGVTGVTLPQSGGGTATFPWVEGSETKTSNGTYDVTNIAEIVINVSGGGGNLVITDVSNTTGTTAEITVSGGGSAQTETGTFTGSGGNTVQISVNFAPDLIYVYGDLSGSPSYRGIINLTIQKDTSIVVTCDSSTSASSENLMYASYGISGYSTDTSNPYASYSSGTLTIDTVMNSGSARWNSSVTYSYKLVKWS